MDTIKGSTSNKVNKGNKVNKVNKGNKDNNTVNNNLNNNDMNAITLSEMMNKVRTQGNLAKVEQVKTLIPNKVISIFRVKNNYIEVCLKESFRLVYKDKDGEISYGSKDIKYLTFKSEELFNGKHGDEVLTKIEPKDLEVNISVVQDNDIITSVRPIVSLTQEFLTKYSGDILKSSAKFEKAKGETNRRLSI